MLSHAQKNCTNIISQLQNSNTMYGLNLPVLVLLFQTPPHLSDPSSHGGQTNVQRTSNKGRTEVKQMLDEKARW